MIDTTNESNINTVVKHVSSKKVQLHCAIVVDGELGIPSTLRTN